MTDDAPAGRPVAADRPIREPSRRHLLLGLGAFGAGAVAGVRPATASPATGWLSARADAANTGHVEDAVPSAPVTPRWVYEASGDSPAAPVVTGGTAYLGTTDGRLHAVDAGTGKRRWRSSRDASIVAPPAVADGTLVAATTEGTVRAVSAANGDERWTVGGGRAVRAAPVVANGRVHVAEAGGLVRALDVETGEGLWTVDLSDGIYGAPAVRDGRVYHATAGGAVVAHDAATGEPRWETDLFRRFEAPPAVAGGRLYVAADRVFALDAATGDRRWTFDADGGGSAPLVATDETVFARGADGGVHAIDAGSGTARYRFDAGLELSSVIGVGDAVCVATGRRVRAVDRTTSGVTWSYDVEPGDSPSLAAAAGVVYAATADGSLYALAGDGATADGTTTTATRTPVTTTTTATRTRATGTGTGTGTPTRTPAPGGAGTARPESSDGSAGGGVDLSVALPVGGVALAAVLAGAYLRRAGRTDDGSGAAADRPPATRAPTTDTSDRSDRDAGSAATGAPQSGTDGDATARVEAGERALSDARTARERGDHDRARSALDDAVSAFEAALDGGAEPSVERAARTGLDEARTALDEIEERRVTLDEVESLLRSAESDVERAVAAFVDGGRTVARVRLRQARDRLEEATTRLEAAGVDRPDVEIPVPTDETLPAPGDLTAGPGIDRATADAVAAAGYEFPTDLRGTSVETLVADVDADLGRTTAERILIRALRTVGPTRSFGTVEDVRARREAVDLAYRLCR